MSELETTRVIPSQSQTRSENFRTAANLIAELSAAALNMSPPSVAATSSSLSSSQSLFRFIPIADFTDYSDEL